MMPRISPGTGHVLDPATHAEQMRRISAIAAKGLDRSPEHIRFVTWTLKYSRCHWLQILGVVGCQPEAILLRVAPLLPRRPAGEG